MLADGEVGLFYELVRPRSEELVLEARSAAARQLAETFGATCFMLFLYDPEIQCSLPAPGFPQTLIDAPRWQHFLRGVLDGESTIETLPDPVTGVELRACGIAAEDKSIAVFLNCELNEHEIQLVKSYLPFVAASLRGEDAAMKARGEVRAAQLASKTAEHLAVTLDKTRGALQQALHDAAKANQSKDEFLAIVSHELRAPLTAILGWTQILLEGGLPEDQALTAYKTIERSAKVQADLIEDLLDYGRVVSGKVRLSMHKIVLADVLHAAIDSVRPAADTRGVTITQMIDPLAGEISGDQSRLQQIAWNLLVNAIKFTSPGGSIQVKLERRQTDVIFSVQDSGRGIAPDFLPHVFERFRQADSSTTRETGGLGLGLAIVKNLVDMHGATIRASSEGLGKGATFTVCFPLSLPGVAEETEIKTSLQSTNALETGAQTAALAVEAISVRPAGNRKSMLKGKKILIVDDNNDARGLLDTLLSRCAAQVTSAASAEEVLKILTSEYFDLLISDIEMPGMDGFTLIKTIRDREAATAKHLPAIALSAHARQADKDLAAEMGFDYHMSKPFDPAELLNRILKVTTPLHAHLTAPS